MVRRLMISMVLRSSTNLNLSLAGMQSALSLVCDKNSQQAGAELGQAQLKLGLNFNSINLN